MIKQLYKPIPDIFPDINTQTSLKVQFILIAHWEMKDKYNKINQR